MCGCVLSSWSWGRRVSGEDRREQAGEWGGRLGSLLWLALAPLVLKGWIWWYWSRRRWWRGALCTSCYLLKALLVPGLAVDTIGGDLPPIWDILADLRPVAVPLAPLAVGLGGSSKADLVLLQRETQRKCNLCIKLQAKDPLFISNTPILTAEHLTATFHCIYSKLENHWRSKIRGVPIQ